MRHIGPRKGLGRCRAPGNRGRPGGATKRPFVRPSGAPRPGSRANTSSRTSLLAVGAVGRGLEKGLGLARAYAAPNLKGW